jgi:hypothetical protein
VTEYALIMAFIALVWVAWSLVRDVWRDLPDEEDEHAEAVKPVGLPHNRRGN